jgi:hypothetical protein
MAALGQDGDEASTFPARAFSRRFADRFRQMIAPNDETSR